MIAIKVLTVNALSIERLANLLESLPSKIREGEREGFGPGCKWWIDEKKVEA